MEEKPALIVSTGDALPFYIDAVIATEEALIEEALRKSKLYQTVLSIAWIQMFLTPIVLIVWYLFSDEFSYSSWKKNIELIAVFACTGVILFIFIGFFILNPIKDGIIKHTKENNAHNF